MTTTSADAPELPPLAAVLKHGNLCFTYWAPPAQAVLAQDCRHGLLRALLQRGERLLVLGARNAADDRMQQHTPALCAVLALLQPAGGHRHMMHLPLQQVDAAWPELLAGQLLWRERVCDDAGLTQVRSHAHGLLALLLPVAAVHDAWQHVPVPAAVQKSVKLVSNARGLLQQDQSLQLRPLLGADTGAVALVWHCAGAMVALGDAQALTGLHQMLGRGTLA